MWLFSKSEKAIVIKLKTSSKFLKMYHNMTREGFVINLKINIIETYIRVIVHCVYLLNFNEMTCNLIGSLSILPMMSYYILTDIGTILTEPLARSLRKYGIRVVTKCFKTLQQEFPLPQFRPRIDLQTNVVFKISCAECPWNYIGETGRVLYNSNERTHQKC